MRKEVMAEKERNEETASSPSTSSPEKGGKSQKLRSVAVVVPVYNDKEAILPTWSRLEQVLGSLAREHEVIFVDDGSTDGAQELLDEHGIRHVIHSENKGYGAAIKTGVLAAKSDLICIIDCDLTYPPQEIPHLLEYTDRYAMVIGARSRFGERLIRRCARVFIQWLLKSLFGQEVLDINSGLRIFDGKQFREYMPGLCDRFSLTSSFTLGFLLDHRPMKYVPIRYDRRTGESKVRNLSYVRNFVKSYLTMYRHHRRLRHGK